MINVVLKHKFTGKEQTISKLDYISLSPKLRNWEFVREEEANGQAKPTARKNEAPAEVIEMLRQRTTANPVEKSPARGSKNSKSNNE